MKIVILHKKCSIDNNVLFSYLSRKEFILEYLYSIRTFNGYRNLYLSIYDYKYLSIEQIGLFNFGLSEKEYTSSPFIDFRLESIHDLIYEKLNV